MASAIPLDTPQHVRQLLRREVNFGCPAPECGSPYLTYHHFDPPKRVRLHHEPQGMIALCWSHHQRAEGGAFTDEQLREMKRHPYLVGPPIRGRFDGWNRRRLVVRLGSDWFFNPAYLLRVGGHILAGFSHVADYGGLDLDVRGADGQPLVLMVANDWNLETLPNGLIAGNWGNRLVVDLSSQGIHFEINFRSFSQEAFSDFLDREGQLASKTDLLASAEEWPLALCSVVGKFVWPSKVAVSEFGTVGPHRHLYQGNISATGGGISFP